MADPLSVGESIEPASRLSLVQRLLVAGVLMEPLSRVAGLAEGGARIVNPLTGAERFVEADTVVFASERRPRVELLTGLDGRVDLRLVGDCLAPRRLLHATLEGFRVALDL